VGLVLPAAYVAGLAALAVVSVGHRVGVPASAAAISAAVANARCVTADSPTLLIETGLLRRDLERGCPLLLDTTGISYDTDIWIRGAARRRINMPQYQNAMRDYYGSSDATLFTRLPDDGLSADTWASIRAQLPVMIRRGAVTLLVRTKPAANGWPSAGTPTDLGAAGSNADAQLARQLETARRD
jgi:alpha-1,2-mannosyltransferase